MKPQPIVSQLPQIYKDLLPSFLAEFVPNETLATCDNCAMCHNKTLPRLPELVYFRPDVKCCSYHPYLPNYLVGGILQSNNPQYSEGKRRIIRKITLRQGITPHGISPPRRVELIQQHGSRAFGQSLSLLCPYFERVKGTCTIWEFRDAVCSSYYCKSVGGIYGQSFWILLREYLIGVQQDLVAFVLLESGWPPQDVQRSKNEDLDLEDIDGVTACTKRYKEQWRAWCSREKEFYVHAFNTINNLKLRDYETICGINRRISLEKLKIAHSHFINPIVPNFLRINPMVVAKVIDNSQWILVLNNRSYVVPDSLLQALKFFDGSVAYKDVLKELEITNSISIEFALIKSLFMNGLLIEN